MSASTASYFIVRGNCRTERRVHVPGRGEQTVELCQLWPKDMCGEFGLFHRSATKAEVSVIAETSLEVLALPKRHFDAMLGSERTQSLILHKYEARCPPEDVLVRRFHEQGRWQGYKAELLHEVVRSLPSEGSKQGAGASAIFGRPNWVKRPNRPSGFSANY